MGRAGSASTPKDDLSDVAALVRAKRTRLAERLHGERRRGFVGRAEQIALFVRLARETNPSLLFVTGQVGVGKSALLRELEQRALDAGHPCLLVDAKTLPDDAAQARSLLHEHLQTLLAQERASDLRGRSILLVDTIDAVAGGYDWLLEQVVSTFPEDLLLVFASRRDVPQSLALDPAWHRLMARLELMPLADSEARLFLELRGVPPEAHGPIVDFVAGYPLALAVAADVTLRSREAGFGLNGLQEVQHALARLLSVRPVSPGQQLALDACSLARTTSAELLDAVTGPLMSTLGGEHQDLFGWLENRSFVEWTPAGLRPHFLSRIALQSRLRRERPRRHRALSLALREFSVSELAAGSRPETDLANLFFLDRDVPNVRRWTPPLEQAPIHPLEPARPGDRPAIVALVRAAEGVEAADLAAACFDRPGDAFEVARGDGLTGMFQLTRFDAAAGPEKLLAQDPVSAPLQLFMKQHPLRDDEESLLVRWFLDRDDYQTPTARVVAITGRLSQLVMNGKPLAYSFCVFRKPDDWVPLWKDIDLPWQQVCRFKLGEHDYSLIAFMWKRRSLRDVLLQAWQEPQPEDATSSARLSFDELRLKVGERVAGLAQKLKLTPRERQILEQLCLGHSLEDVAKALSIRPRTVKFHQENLLRKTGASSRAELFKKLL